jgi:hypothetical protein
MWGGALAKVVKAISVMQCVPTLSTSFDTQGLWIEEALIWFWDGECDRCRPQGSARTQEEFSLYLVAPWLLDAVFDSGFSRAWASAVIAFSRRLCGKLSQASL